MTGENEHNCIDKDDLLHNTKLNIDKFGLQVIMVSSTSYCPSFAYSIGLTETYNHPEIICFGLSNDLGHAIINDIAELIKNGEKFEAEKISTEIFKDSRAAFLKVDKKPIILQAYSAIGAHSLVFPGTILREGAVLGSMSLANKELQEWKIYAGIPARRRSPEPVRGRRRRPEHLQVPGRHH